jgi:hypothetical protein
MVRSLSLSPTSGLSIHAAGLAWPVVRYFGLGWDTQRKDLT